MQCKRCGKCCRKSPCKIPVMHMASLRYILVHEFGTHEKVAGLDIVAVMFRYDAETLHDKIKSDKVSGYFIPLGTGAKGTRCMWLEKRADGYACKLFWNKTADQLVGFAEQVVGKGCTMQEDKFARIIPMIYKDSQISIS